MLLLLVVVVVVEAVAVVVAVVVVMLAVVLPSSVYICPSFFRELFTCIWHCAAMYVEA